MNYLHRITVQTRGTGKTSMGGPSTTWTTVGVYACRVRQIYGRELMAAQQLQPEATLEVSMDYVPGITATMRGVFNGRYIEFKQVQNVDEGNREIRILAAEGKTSG